jgi:hypothetical protein
MEKLELFGLKDKDGNEYKLTVKKNRFKAMKGRDQTLTGETFDCFNVDKIKKPLPKTKDDLRKFLEEAACQYGTDVCIDNFLEEYDD